MLESAGALACPEGPDAKDFERWYRAHHARLRAFCTRLTGDQATAEDIAQETLLRAWARRADFERNRDIRSWLYTVARNLSIETLRTRSRVVTGDVPEQPDAEADPVVPIERAEERRMIRSALSEMTPRHRDMLVARDVHGVGYEELARRLGVSEDTARAVLFRARRRLRERFLAASRAMGIGFIAFKAKVFGAARRASQNAVAFQTLSGPLAQAGAALGAAAVMMLAPQAISPLRGGGPFPVPPRLTVQVVRGATRPAPIKMPAPGANRAKPGITKPVSVSFNHRNGGGADTRLRNPVSGDSEHAWVHVWRQAGGGDSEVLNTLDQTCEQNQSTCETVDRLFPQG